jgi:hypothetical protein
MIHYSSLMAVLYTVKRFQLLGLETVITTLFLHICLCTSLQIKRKQQPFTYKPDQIPERSHNESNCAYVNGISKRYFLWIHYFVANEIKNKNYSPSENTLKLLCKVTTHIHMCRNTEALELNCEMGGSHIFVK